MTETFVPKKGTQNPLPTIPEPATVRRTEEYPALVPEPTVTAHKDPRRAALLRFAISITILNVAGHVFLGFEQAPLVPIAAVLVAYAASLGLEFLDAWGRDTIPGYAGGWTNMFYFLLPAHIAALACSILIYGQSMEIYLFAVVVSIGSKYLFRIRVRGRPRHYLNPSNFGISITLLLMPAVGFVPPYMFLNNTDGVWDWAIPLILLTAGTMLNAKLTRRMPLILAWVGGYVVVAIIRTVVYDDSIWGTLGMMTGVAFILFTNYMITDPGTTPMSTRGQVAFGLTCAMCYGALIVVGVAYAIFFALILTCILRGGLIWITERRRIAAGHTGTGPIREVTGASS